MKDGSGYLICGMGLDFDVGSWKVGRLVRFMCKNKILTGWMDGWMAVVCGRVWLYGEG